MNRLPVRLYAAFAAEPFGGNMAGIVYDEVGLSADAMQGIAADLAVPTTGFVRQAGDDSFAVRFFSSRAEMDMCGHVTVGVFAALHDDGRLAAGDRLYTQVTPAGNIPVTVARSADSVQVSMRQNSPRFGLVSARAEDVAGPLGIEPGDILALDASSTALSHLFVQLRDIAALSKIRPADAALRRLSQAHAIDTIGVWCLRRDGVAMVRLRDLCHGVGDPEEAASGTTSGALACLLFKRGLLQTLKDGEVRIEVEQGVEMRRPSRIVARLRYDGETIETVEVGGTAQRRLSGDYLLPR